MPEKSALPPSSARPCSFSIHTSPTPPHPSALPCPALPCPVHHPFIIRPPPSMGLFICLHLSVLSSVLLRRSVLHCHYQCHSALAVPRSTLSILNQFRNHVNRSLHFSNSAADLLDIFLDRFNSSRHATSDCFDFLPYFLFNIVIVKTKFPNNLVTCYLLERLLQKKS